MALRDFDGDGVKCILQVIGGEYPGDVFPRALFINPGNTNHWLTLRLEGTKTNRSAIGARISVEVETPHGARTLHAVVSSGGSYGGSTLAQEVGLGDATRIIRVEVTWPTSGIHQRFENVSMDHRFRVIEGKPELVALSK